MRAALGAGAWQLARQSFCESLLLCTAGSAAGLALAGGTFAFLARLAPGDPAGLNALSVDWRVLAFTAAAALLTAVVFGLVPMAQNRRMDVSQSLKQSARTLAAASGSRHVRWLLVSSEVALAFVLLIGAGLLLQTLANVRRVDPGFDTDNLLTMILPPPKRGGILSRSRRGSGKCGGASRPSPAWSRPGSPITFRSASRATFRASARMGTTARSASSATFAWRGRATWARWAFRCAAVGIYRRPMYTTRRRWF